MEKPLRNCANGCGYIGPPKAKNVCARCGRVIKDMQRNKSRCYKCNKNVKLMGVKCHCGYLFCLAHKNPEDHICDFEFKVEGRKQLTKDNPVVNAPKFSKI